MAIKEHGGSGFGNSGDGLYPPFSPEETSPKGRDIRPNELDSELEHELRPHPSNWLIVEKSDAQDLSESESRKFYVKDGKHWRKVRDGQTARRYEEWFCFTNKTSPDKKSGGGAGKKILPIYSSGGDLPLDIPEQSTYLNLDPTVSISSPRNGRSLKLTDVKSFKNRLANHTFVEGDTVASVANDYSGSDDPEAIYNFNPRYSPRLKPQTGDPVRVLAGRELRVDGTVQNSSYVTLSWQGPNPDSKTIDNTKGGDNEMVSWETTIPAQAGTLTLTAKASGAVSNSVTIELLDPNAHWLEVDYRDQNGEPVEDVDFTVRFNDGSEIKARLNKGFKRLDQDVKLLPFEIEFVESEKLKEELKILREQLREALDASVAQAGQEAAYLAKEWEKVSAIEGGFIYIGGLMTGIGQWVGDTVGGLVDLITGAVKSGAVTTIWMSQYSAHRGAAARAFAEGDEATFNQEMKTIEDMHMELGEDISDGLEAIRTLALVLYDDEARQMLIDHPMNYYKALDNVEQVRIGARYGIDVLLILAGGLGVGLLAMKGAPRIAQIVKQIAEKWKLLKLWQKARRDTVDRKHEFTPPPVKRLESKPVKCFKNKKGGTAEYDRQLKGQQDGLNNMTAEEYLEGRKAYTGKRASTAEARDRYNKELVNKYWESGMSKTEAQAKAASDMKTLNALHNPDMIAGGKDKVTDFGDGSVNKSIGSQWNKKNKGATTSRVEELDKTAKKAIASGDGSKKMNVKLERCK